MWGGRGLGHPLCQFLMAELCSRLLSSQLWSWPPAAPNTLLRNLTELWENMMPFHSDPWAQPSLCPSGPSKFCSNPHGRPQCLPLLPGVFSFWFSIAMMFSSSTKLTEIKNESQVSLGRSSQPTFAMEITWKHFPPASRILVSLSQPLLHPLPTGLGKEVLHRLTKLGVFLFSSSLRLKVKNLAHVFLVSLPCHRLKEKPAVSHTLQSPWPGTTQVGPVCLPILPAALPRSLQPCRFL